MCIASEVIIIFKGVNRYTSDTSVNEGQDGHLINMLYFQYIEINV